MCGNAVYVVQGLYQHPCIAACSYAGTAFASLLCALVLLVGVPAGAVQCLLLVMLRIVKACKHEYAEKCRHRTAAMQNGRGFPTAALATAKLASLETALTSPSDLMIRFTRASGKTCTGEELCRRFCGDDAISMLQTYQA